MPVKDTVSLNPCFSTENGVVLAKNIPLPSNALPEAAQQVLLGAKPGEGALEGKWVIERTLGWQTYLSKGASGRKDIAPLYAAGLVEEWFAPDCPPLFLTSAGEAMRQKLDASSGLT